MSKLECRELSQGEVVLERESFTHQSSNGARSLFRIGARLLVKASEVELSGFERLQVGGGDDNTDLELVPPFRRYFLKRAGLATALSLPTTPIGQERDMLLRRLEVNDYFTHTWGNRGQYTERRVPDTFNEHGLYIPTGNYDIKLYKQDGRGRRLWWAIWTITYKPDETVT